MKVLLAEIKDIDPIKDAQALPEKYKTLITMFPIGFLMNAMFLQQMYAHIDDARAYFLEVTTGHGSSSELVYYSLLAISISVCIANLTATLRYRKLISKDMEYFAIIGALVVTLVTAKGAVTF